MKLTKNKPSPYAVRWKKVGKAVLLLGVPFYVPFFLLLVTGLYSEQCVRLALGAPSLASERLCYWLSDLVLGEGDRRTF